MNEEKKPVNGLMGFLARTKIYDSSIQMEGRRNCYIDNARFLMITLVVITHFTQTTGVFTGLWKYVYFFHMPAFLFLSGYFAKPQRNAKKCMGILMLYCISQVLFIFVERVFLGTDCKISLFYPKFGLWYLVAIFFYLLLLPLMDLIKPWILFAGLYALGLIMGVDRSVGEFMSLSRIFVFAPFYMMGYYANKTKVLERLSQKMWLQNVCRAVAVLALIAVVYLQDGIRGQVLTSKRSYDAMNLTNPEGLLHRAGFYIIGTLLVWVILLAVPRGKAFFTRVGTNCVTIYLIHILLVDILINTGAFPVIQSYVTKWGLIVLAVLLVFVLSPDFLAKPLNRLMKGEYPWLYKKETEQ